MTNLVGGIGLPTILLLLQLIAGLAAATDLVRSALRRRFGLHTIGQVVLALLLITLGVDGLFLHYDVVGQAVYSLDLEPSLVRPALIAVIVGGTALWMLDR